MSFGKLAPAPFTDCAKEHTDKLSAATATIFNAKRLIMKLGP